jgi:Mg-chelatase subunit ChlD
VQIEPGSDYEIRWQISLIEPDFSSKVFTRWDLPSYLSMDNGIMFPGEMKTYLEGYNTTLEDLGNTKVVLNLPSSLMTTNQIYDIDLESELYSYTPIDLTAKLIYEDRIVEIKADIVESETILESINRKMFIPATPVSDTGLVIVNDSISVYDFPRTDLIFSVEQEKTGQRVLSLDNENVFLYENNQRIHDFNLTKFTEDGANQADIVFVLDVTGSMGDEINDVKLNLVEFTDSLSMRGIDYRLGMVTFLDIIENVYDFTSDVQLFQQYVNQQYAHGGGDGPENSLDALDTAIDFEFRPTAKRIFIWITDAPYHQENSVTNLSAEDVVNELLENAITVYCIGNSAYLSSAYNNIILPVGGTYFDIYGNFRDILIEISRQKVQDKYILSFTSNLPSGENIDLTLELHYAGLGVIKTYSYLPKPIVPSTYNLSCYPNPFNPDINFQIEKPQDLTGDISIYNVLGQRVQKFELPAVPAHKIVWDGRNEAGKQIGSGFYIVHLILKDSQGIRYRESTRILHLK